MHDAVKNAMYTYSYKQDVNLASDSRKGVSVAYNVLGLPRTVTSGTTVLSHYEYLPDGSKLSALAGSGAGYKYRGSFVYSVDASGNEKLESVACDEGRISVTYSGSGAASYRDDWHVRDYLGNTRLVVNITSASTPPSTGKGRHLQHRAEPLAPVRQGGAGHRRERPRCPRLRSQALRPLARKMDNSGPYGREVHQLKPVFLLCGESDNIGGSTRGYTENQ